MTLKDRLNLINYLESKGIDVIENAFKCVLICMGYEHKFIKLMNTSPMSYNTYMFKTKDIKEISIIDYEIEIKTETREGIFDRRHRVFNFDASPIFEQLKKEQK